MILVNSFRMRDGIRSRPANAKDTTGNTEETKSKQNTDRKIDSLCYREFSVNVTLTDKIKHRENGN